MSLEEVNMSTFAYYSLIINVFAVYISSVVQRVKKKKKNRNHNKGLGFNGVSDHPKDPRSPSPDEGFRTGQM